MTSLVAFRRSTFARTSSSSARSPSRRWRSSPRASSSASSSKPCRESSKNWGDHFYLSSARAHSFFFWNESWARALLLIEDKAHLPIMQQEFSGSVHLSHELGDAKWEFGETSNTYLTEISWPKNFAAPRFEPTVFRSDLALASCIGPFQMAPWQTTLLWAKAFPRHVHPVRVGVFLTKATYNYFF